MIHREHSQDALLSLLPAATERPIFALAVSLTSGVIAGLTSAFISHPADTVVTRSALGGFGSNWRAALDDVLDGTDGPVGGARALYAGVWQRCAYTRILHLAKL